MACAVNSSCCELIARSVASRSAAAAFVLSRHLLAAVRLRWRGLIGAEALICEDDGDDEDETSCCCVCGVAETAPMATPWVAHGVWGSKRDFLSTCTLAEQAIKGSSGGSLGLRRLVGDESVVCELYEKPSASSSVVFEV